MGKKKSKGKQKSKASAKRPLRTEQENVDSDLAVAEKPQTGKEKYSIEQLLDKAEEYVDTFQYELAQKFCEKALAMDSDNLRALETSGVLLMELGEMDKAKSCFGRAIELAPSVGHSKYMYMGQLMTGDVAVQCFTKGIEIMKKQLKSQKKQKVASNVEDELTERDVSSAHCSIAEMYLTDECFEDSADEKCKENLDAAVATDPKNPEAHQLMASYWLSKDEKEKAKESIEKGVMLWLPQMKDAENSEGAAGLDPVEVCDVGYPARVNACKLLIEVENFDMASEVLELLLDEDDQIVEVWYLLGWLNHLQGEDYKGNARTYLSRGKEIAIKTKFDDKDMLKHMDELLTELGPEEAEAEEDADDEEIKSEDEVMSDEENEPTEESMEH